MRSTMVWRRRSYSLERFSPMRRVEHVSGPTWEHLARMRCASLLRRETTRDEWALRARKSTSPPRPHARPQLLRARLRTRGSTYDNSYESPWEGMGLAG